MKVFDESIPGFSPYNGLQWEPNGSRSKRQFEEPYATYIEPFFLRMGCVH